MAKETAKLTPRQKKRRRARENAKKRKKAEKDAVRRDRLERRARRNPDFGRGCFDKQRHESVTDAFKSISALFRKKSGVNRLSVYRCRACSGYHLTSAKFRAGKTYYVFTMDRDEWIELQKGRQP